MLAVDITMWTFLKPLDICLDFILQLVAASCLFMSGWMCTVSSAAGQLEHLWIIALAFSLLLTFVLLFWTFHATYPSEEKHESYGWQAKTPARIVIIAVIGLPFILATYFAGYCFNLRHTENTANANESFVCAIAIGVVWYLLMVGWMAWCHRQLEFWATVPQWRVEPGDERLSRWTCLLWKEPVICANRTPSSDCVQPV